MSSSLPPGGRPDELALHEPRLRRGGRAYQLPAEPSESMTILETR
jgi:hypothetical protein